MAQRAPAKSDTNNEETEYALSKVRSSPSKSDVTNQVADYAPRPRDTKKLLARWAEAIRVIDELRAQRGRIEGKKKTRKVWDYE